jgi:hypothetical protein
MRTMPHITGEFRRSRSSERRNSILVVAGFIIAVACGDPYVHSNPYDPVFPVTFEITGPDSVLSIGQVAQYSVQTTPVFPDSAIQWDIDSVTIVKLGVGDTIVDGTTVFAPDGSGGYMSINPPLEPATVKIAVEVLLGAVDTTVQRYINGQFVTIETHTYRHIGYKEVVLTQRLVRIRLRCPDTPSCAPMTVGGTWSVWVDGFDALNNQMHQYIGVNANPRTGTPVVTYAIRDTTIATLAPDGIRAATVTARKSGTTWIVATRSTLVDSLQLVVQ